MRSEAHLRYGTALTEALVMASRNGIHFERWNEAFMRPGIQRPETWQYGQHYVAWHAVETESSLPGAANELSLYSSEGGWTGDSNVMRRYTLRLDGFVSVHGKWKGGTMTTKPVRFEGNRLQLNFSTSAVGRIRIGIQTADGRSIEGFGLNDCSEIFGDSVERTVVWGDRSDVSTLAGRPVRLIFEVTDGDLYAYQFVGLDDSP